jgi:hypothetical protein
VWVQDDSHAVFGQTFPEEKAMWGGALSWRNDHFSCNQNLGRSFLTFSPSHNKKSHEYAELTDWATRTSFLWIILLISKKIMSMLSALLSVCLAFFDLSEFGLLQWQDSCFVSGS